MFDDGSKLNEKYVWHKINGQNYHWNEPHEGLKYGIVLYKQKAKRSKTQQMMMARKKKQQQQAEPREQTEQTEQAGVQEVGQGEE